VVEELSAQAAELVGATGIDWSRLLEPDMIVRILVQVLLLCASAFFSSSEVALFSLSRMDLDRLRRERHPVAGSLYGLLEQPRRLIISILCGNEFVNIAAAANMAAILLSLVGEGQAGLINLLIMVPVLLLFGEVTPKTIAISDPLRLSTRVIARPMSFWVRAVTPVRWLVRLWADRLTILLVGEEKSPENILVADEIRLLARELEQTGELRLEERALMDSFLAAGTTEVVEVMTPRTRMTFIEHQMPVRDVVDLARKSHQLRFPVFKGHRDNLLGMVHTEDLMTAVIDRVDLDSMKLEDLLHPTVVVPPTKKLDEVLEYCRDKDVSAAIVLNEFGGVDGMVTLRMVLDVMFRPVSGVVVDAGEFAGPRSGTFDVPGEMKLTDFHHLTGFNLTDSRMTTVGGLVYRHLDRLPAEGDSVVADGVGLLVLEMAEHRIVRVRAGRAGDVIEGGAD
jgi:CBS domain containing-hemolysin-like protein